MKKYLELLYEITLRNLKIKYKDLKGLFFLIINPIIQTTVISLFLSYFIKVESYFIFLLSGSILWQYFSQTIMFSTESLVNERKLIYKSKFNIEIIPLSISLSNFVIHLPSIIGLILYKFIIGFESVEQFFILLLTILLLLALTSSLAIIFSIVGVYFRSFNYVINALLPLIFYSTPIIYKLEMLPENLKKISSISPISGCIQLFHYSLLNINPSYPKIIFFGLTLIIFIIWVSKKIIEKKGPLVVDKL